MRPVDDWVHKTLLGLAKFQFSSEHARRLENASISFLPWKEARASRGPRVVVPIDIPTDGSCSAAWRAPFNGTEVTLWDRIERPSEEWISWPGGDKPIWWHHRSGTLLPGWNLWANVRALLTFEDDRRILKRDSHGRLPVAEVPRFQSGTLDVPIANEANALLLDAVLSRSHGELPRLCLPIGSVMAPGLSISHDCDQLRGNDLYTQAARVMRALRALGTLELRTSGLNIRAIVENAVQPRKYYFDNMIQMLELERQFGFRSTAYLLNGTGGRFGARSGSAMVERFIGSAKGRCSLGIHYNYDTFNASLRFQKQHQDLECMVGGPIFSGRAHYLRFDPITSPSFLSAQGISFDESLGWADVAAYRCGIAGPFRLFDDRNECAFPLVELPLTISDAVLLREPDRFVKLLRHLERIGGMLSVLIHPGAFDNPENPKGIGLYGEVLTSAMRAGCRSWTPEDILAELTGTSEFQIV